MVDARGLSCPEPVVRTKKALDKHPEKEEVIVDNRVAFENVSRYAKVAHYKVVSTKEEGLDYHLFLEKA